MFSEISKQPGKKEGQLIQWLDNKGKFVVLFFVCVLCFFFNFIVPSITEIFGSKITFREESI